MSGFDAGKVNTEFFSDGKWRVNLICNLGYGDHSKLFPRSPRFAFDQIAKINGGRTFYTTPDSLGGYVLVDFIQHRRVLRPAG